MAMTTERRPPTYDPDQSALWPEWAPSPPTCAYCGRPLNPNARADASYCSTSSTCRVRAHRRRSRQ